MVLVAKSPVLQAEVMAEPGAKMSTHAPKVEDEARASLLAVAPTVKDPTARAGEKLQAFEALLPAATATTTPALTRLVTALSSACEMPPPRLMLATAGERWLLRTQSTPAMIPE